MDIWIFANNPSLNTVASASKIQARHEFVVAHIGSIEEEKNAFDLMSRLIWQLPLFIVVTALLDLLLVLVYMKLLHPWRAILEDVSRSPASTNHDLDPQEPEVWGPQIFEGKMPEVSSQIEGQDNMLMKSFLSKVSRNYAKQKLRQYFFFQSFIRSLSKISTIASFFSL